MEEYISMKINKTISVLGRYWKRFVSLGTGFLVLLGILDYFTKWGIFRSLLNFFLKVSPYLNILFLLWFLILTILIIRQILKRKKEFASSINKIITPKIIETLEGRFKKFIASELKARSFKVNSRLDNIDNELFEINRRNVVSTIEDALARGKSATKLMIKLLEMNIDKGWEFRIHEVLKMILDRLKKYKVTSEDSASLIKQLDRLEKKYGKIKNEIEGLIVIA